MCERGEESDELPAHSKDDRVKEEGLGKRNCLF